MNAKLGDELLTPDEVIAKLKLRRRDWLYQRVHTHTLPFEYLKIGGLLRFPASGVDRFIERATRPGNGK